MENIVADCPFCLDIYHIQGKPDGKSKLPSDHGQKVS